MRRVLLQMLVLLAAYGMLVVWFPETTVSPGDLIPGHEPLAGDCFRCHEAFRGIATEKCVACHEIAKIGVARTTGAAIARAERRPAFHQALLDPACAACHGAHLGASRPGANARFTHELLRPDVLATCSDCHRDRTPNDDLHRTVGTACGRCHGFAAWTPATFEHAALPPAQRRGCVACHTGARPSDRLHTQAGADCAACHGTEAWKPATFEHENLFRFDRHHPGDQCQSCHPDTLDRYTCYGCHEHTPQGIAREHREEGITSFENCVECHRSGDEHEAKRGRSGARGRRSGHDD